MASNPIPVPLLHTLASSPQQKKDVDDLRLFLYLMWEKLGGADDPFIDSESAVDIDSAVSRLKSSDELLASRVDYLEQDYNPLPEISALRERLDALESDHSPPIDLSDILKRLNAIEAQL